MQYLAYLMVLIALSGCSKETDFSTCEKESSSPSRMADMTKCMENKHYHLNGVKGTVDVFTQPKWEKN